MSDIERRIPESLGTTDALLDNAPFVGTVDVTDGAVAFGPAVFVFVISNQIIPEDYSWIGFILGLLTASFGIMVLVGKPNYLSLSDWLSNYWDYRNRPTKEMKELRTDGGYSSGSKPITNNPDTRDKILVERIFPDSNAIERPDGTVVGMVELGGMNLDTALPNQWERSADSLSNFFNTQINYDIQFYLPMRQFDPSGHVKNYRDRSETAFQEQNPILLDYLEDRASWLMGIAYDSYVRECYVIVTVQADDVLNSELQADSSGLFDPLKNTGVGELVADAVSGLRGTNTFSQITESELKERQLRELNRRLSEVEAGIGGGGSMATQKVSSNKAGILLKEYWEGVDIPSAQGENLVRKQPFVTRGTDQNSE